MAENSKIQNERFRRNMKKREDHFKAIYNKANELLAILGAEGTINSESSVSDNLMGALRDFDGGQYDTKKMFPKPVIGKKNDILEDIEIK
jgi:hypothetical protein